jgi:hypothetical protein
MRELACELFKQIVGARSSRLIVETVVCPLFMVSSPLSGCYARTQPNSQTTG